MAELQNSIVALTALVTALSGLVPVIIVLWNRVNRQGRRIELFWRSRILRGTAEALAHNLVIEDVRPEDTETEAGFMTVAVTPRVYKAYEPIADKLVALKKSLPEAVEEELAEAIEKRFGPWLSRHICTVLGVSEYACIVMAVSIANGIRPCEIPPEV